MYIIFGRIRKLFIHYTYITFGCEHKSLRTHNPHISNSLQFIVKEIIFIRVSNNI